MCFGLFCFFSQLYRDMSFPNLKRRIDTCYTLFKYPALYARSPLPARSLLQSLLAAYLRQVIAVDDSELVVQLVVVAFLSSMRAIRSLTSLSVMKKWQRITRNLSEEPMISVADLFFLCYTILFSLLSGTFH